VNQYILYIVDRPNRIPSRTDDTAGDLAAVAALAEPLRRRLYQFVCAQDHAVGRDEAAGGAGVSRSAAAFHLDRLVEDGLLDTEFRRLTERRGPGAGRPAKLYRRADREIAVSLPARRYELAARLLAAAVAEAGETGHPVASVLDRLAREHGARMASAVGPASASAPARAVAGALAAEGYEARSTPAGIVLANCPFSGVAAEHPGLVCGMNLALLEGFAAALPDARLAARLVPTDGSCCVRLDVHDP
jgi:predicted ArsR family transcriptional regulator